MASAWAPEWAPTRRRSGHGVRGAIQPGRPLTAKPAPPATTGHPDPAGTANGPRDEARHRREDKRRGEWCPSARRQPLRNEGDPHTAPYFPRENSSMNVASASTHSNGTALYVDTRIPPTER